MALGITYSQESLGLAWALANVQRVDWSYGRQNLLDQYSPASCNIYGRRPDLLGGTPAIGDFLTIYVTEGGQSAIFGGVVADYRVIYGITSTYDTWELRLDGALSYVARTYTTITTTAGASTFAMANSISSAAPYSLVYVAGTPSQWGSTTSAQTLTDSLGTTMQTLVTTEQGTIQETTGGLLVQAAVLNIWPRNYASASTITFADDGTAGAYKYNEIEFRGTADNYSTKVIVSATGFADQTSGSGDYQVNVDTISGSTTEAANLAGYIKTSLDLNQNLPFAIRFSGALNQSTPAAISSGNPASTLAGAVVKFRGTTYKCRILGSDFMADQTDWQTTLYLSSSLANAWFVLGSTTNGVLGTNKLGF